MIVLASASPRRRELLSRIADEFVVKVADIDESTSYNRPHLAVMDIARRKCEAVCAQCDEGDVVIAADTVVYHGGEILGKPVDRAHAIATLKRIEGREHIVYTGVCVRKDGKTVVYYEKSVVKMAHMSDEFIARYVDGGSPMDKAGAYGAQDEGTIDGYRGEFENIMGLPLVRLKSILRDKE